MHSTRAAGWALPCLIQMGMLLKAEPSCWYVIDAAWLQYVTVALIQHTCNTLQLHWYTAHLQYVTNNTMRIAWSHVPSVCSIFTDYRCSIVGACWMSHVSSCHVGPVVPVCPCLGNRGLGIHLHARQSRAWADTMSEESVMSSSVRDITESTEAEGRDDTHHISRHSHISGHPHTPEKKVKLFAYYLQIIWRARIVL